MTRAGRYDRPIPVAVLKPAISPKDQTAAFAAIVRNELRVPDVLGHLGNGVLVVVLPETALEPARGLTSRLCLLLEAQGPAMLIEQANASSAEIDLDFQWEVAGQEEFGFAE